MTGTMLKDMKPLAPTEETVTIKFSRIKTSIFFWRTSH